MSSCSARAGSGSWRGYLWCGCCRRRNGPDGGGDDDVRPPGVTLELRDDRRGSGTACRYRCAAVRPRQVAAAGSIVRHGFRRSVSCIGRRGHHHAPHVLRATAVNTRALRPQHTAAHDREVQYEEQDDGSGDAFAHAFNIDQWCSWFQQSALACMPGPRTAMIGRPTRCGLASCHAPFPARPRSGGLPRQHSRPRGSE